MRLGCISYEFYWIWIFCITSTLAFYVILTGYSPNCTFELQTCEVFSLNYFSDFTTCSSGEVCSHKNLVFRLKHILVLFLYFLFCGLAILGRACHQVSSICAKSRDISIFCAFAKSKIQITNLFCALPIPKKQMAKQGYY